MTFRPGNLLSRLLMILFAIAALEGAAHAQFTVSIAIPSPTPVVTAPTGSFTVRATISGNSNSIAKVVFYRNDVPYLTDTSSTYDLPQDALGQDTYTYRARAYDSTGVFVDSSDLKLTIHTKQVVKMGQTIGGTSTTGPSRTKDHTDEIKAAVAWLGSNGGGTLLFPCKFVNDSISVYNIRDTIDVPDNVTLQGESAEDFGRCRIYWIDAEHQGGACADNDGTLTNKPMFRVKGDVSGVRFKDLWLWSLSAGIGCWPRSDVARIAGEKTNAIELNNKDYGGHIRDVIVENVCIESFTWGIKAISNSDSDEISDIKIRAYRATGNHRQIFIDAKYAYNWDVQNVNAYLHQTQGAVEIVNAGRPGSPVGPQNPKLKFLQVNCAGNRAAPPDFCVQVSKHGGLYFRQLHHEGVNEAIIVEDISESETTATTNPDPIVFESGVATGTFKDASMKLYLIGNAAFAAPEVANPGQDTGRLRFIEGGLTSTVVDCGDVHFDVTDTNPAHQGTPKPTPEWGDLGMYHSHTELNRASFFAQDADNNKYFKSHTICPQGVSELLNINEVGGEYFDSGVMPTETGTYSNELNSTTCPSPCDDASGALQDLLDDSGGTVYINGSYTLLNKVTIPPGAQIVGTVGYSQLTLGDTHDNELFLIEANTTELPRAAGIVIRDLKLSTTETDSRAGIRILGDPDGVGAASDIHFSGVTIENFAYGLDIRPTVIDPSLGPQPMVDGISLKNMTFENNLMAVRSYSANASNWNVMNVKMTSNTEDAIGWEQKGGGHESLQNVICQGDSSELLMSDCLKLSNTGTYLAGVKANSRVTNALTVFESILTHIVVRDSDFRSSATTQATVNLLGRAFIVSMNNKYDDFNVESPFSTDPFWRGDYSRLTYCGDTYAGSVYSGGSNGLSLRHPNLIVGGATLTRVQCGTRPIPWDDAIRLGGGATDKPLAGNFFDDVREDFVVYREGITGATQSYFLAKEAGNGVGHWTIAWGLKDDVGMIARFYPSTRAQIVIWRPSTGDFWAYDPNANTYTTWHWGQSGDIPFIGNFFDETGSGNYDEVAVYRPSANMFYIYNPRSGQNWYQSTDAANGSKIQVGDFLGAGYDQIARVSDDSGNLKWKVVDPRTGTPYTMYFGETGDVPVAGKYLSGACTQVGVWRPTVSPPFGFLEPVHSQFMIKDPTFASCGSRDPIMVWGSNNDSTTTAYLDDIPLTINTADGSLRRPTAYRPTAGAFTYSLSAGQWWVHDPY